MSIKWDLRYFTELLLYHFIYFSRLIRSHIMYVAVKANIKNKYLFILKELDFLSLIYISEKKHIAIFYL